MDKIVISTLPSCSDLIRQELAPALVAACRSATQAEAAKHVHFESLESFSAHMEEDGGQHVVLYDTAQSVVRTAYEEERYGDEILLDWLAAIDPTLALYKKNRRRMSFAAGQSFLEDPHSSLKSFLEKLHLSVDETKFDPDQFVESIRKEFSVWSRLLATYAVLHEPDLHNKISELEVGSLTLRTEAPNPAAASIEINGYKAKIATLTDSLEKQQMQGAELKNKIDAIVLKASAAERARQEVEQQCDILNATNELLCQQISSMTKEHQQLFVKSEKQRHTGAELFDKRAELDKKQAELDNKQAELDNKQAELDNKQAELDNKQAELDAFFASRSWRVTAPMRAIRRALRI